MLAAVRGRKPDALEREVSLPKGAGMAEGTRLQLNLTTVVASALATTSAAVAASFIGVYGTIIGAAIMSVVSTVGSTVYEHYMRRSKAKLQNVREAHLTNVPTGVVARMRRGIGLGVTTLPSSAWGRLRAQLAKPGWWKPVAAVSLLVFAIAMGFLTIVEGAVGKSTADIVRAGNTDNGSSGTTWGRAFGGGADRNDSDQDGSGEGGSGQEDAPDSEASPTEGQTGSGSGDNSGDGGATQDSESSPGPTQDEDSSDGSTPEPDEPAPTEDAPEETEPPSGNRAPEDSDPGAQRAPGPGSPDAGDESGEEPS